MHGVGCAVDHRIVYRADVLADVELKDAGRTHAAKVAFAPKATAFIERVTEPSWPTMKNKI